MELRNLKNEIINENGVCSIRTETTFSDLVLGDGIILAMSKERKQLIKYTSNLDIISVEPIEYTSMKEYRFKNLLFLAFYSKYRFEKLMMVRKGKAKWINLQVSEDYYRISRIVEIYQLQPKKYIIITSETKQYDRKTELCHNVVAEVNLDKNKTKQMFTSLPVKSLIDGRRYYDYNYEKSPRFIFIYNYSSITKVLDLYTGFSYVIPDSSVKYQDDIVVCYSSREIIVLQINQGYYLYINGYLVYQYALEEYESVLYNLKNNIIKHSHEVENSKTEYFFTLSIGESLCIWKKREKPEMIAL